MKAARRMARAYIIAGVCAGVVFVAGGCGLDRAVGGETPGAVIFDRPDTSPARESAGERLARLGQRLLDLARGSLQPVPILFPDLHEPLTLNGTD